MAVIKLNFSLDEQVATLMRQRASELNVPASRYLADLVLQEERRHQDQLAAEGYQLLSTDTAAFVGAAWPLARETWPEWETSQQESAASAPASRKGNKGVI